MAPPARAAVLELAAGEVVVAANGVCSLREAFNNANTDTQADNADCPAGSGPDVIELAAGATYTLPDEDPLGVFSGLRRLTTDIVVHGNGSTVERDGSLTCALDGSRIAGAEFRLLRIGPGGDVTLDDLILRNGCADGGGNGGDGGALQIDDATLVLNRVTVTDNVAWDKSGGLDTRDSTVTIVDSTFSFNFAGGGGGAIGNGNGSAMTIEGTTVADNTAAGLGGGGVGNYDTVTIVNSTISRNRDVGTFGGGGGIGNLGTAVLVSSTLRGNSSTGPLGGGGIGNAGDIEVKSSLVAESTAGGDCFNHPGGASFDASGANLDTDGTCAALDAAFTQVTPAALALGALTDNGGPTATHALLAGSVAVDAVIDCTLVDGVTPVTVDQRGEPRPIDGDGDGEAFCDAGAVERSEPPGADLTVTVTDKQTSAVPGEALTYIVTVANAGPGAAAGAAVTDLFPVGLSCIWTCTAAGGATCTAGPVAGDIEDTVDLPAGAVAGYAALCAIDPGRTGTLANAATVAPGVAADPVPANNSATDFTLLTPVADLAITKDDGVTTAAPGDVLTYTIEVSNPGPSDALAAAVEDVFPPELIGCEWSCAPAGGALCTGGPVAGDLTDSVDLFAGSSATYTATCTVDPGASFSELSNTATVAAPAGVTDPDLTDNAATDVDLGSGMIFADGFESGDTAAWSATTP
jgi:uncharacterized repeat protein (TIGR01451 family)